MSTKQAQPNRKVLPHNLEAEQGVLGCILLDNDTTAGAFSSLSESDFYSPSHKTIFTTMKSIYEAGSPVDFVTLVSSLDGRGLIDSIGGIGYITTLNEVVPSSANFRYYLDILKKNKTLRQLIGAANQIVDNSFSGLDAGDVLQSAEKIIFDIAKDDERKEMSELASLMPGVIDKLDTVQKDPTSVRGLQSGFYGLDNMTNGFQKADMIIIAARPSVGKTSLGLNMVLHAAIRDKKRCAVFSLEMSRQALAARALCSVAGVSLSKAMKGDMSTEEWDRILRANRSLSQASVYVDDNSIITPAEIMRKCMRLKREGGLDLVMIDYLGLMTSGNIKRESRQVEVSDNSRMIKIMAKELDVPVLLLSQLNRGIEGRKGADSRPMLSDLRESGAIEQDADIVMFIHREKSEENEEEVKVGEVELVVAKHRNGPTGTVKLGWHSESTTFKNLQHDKEAYEARQALIEKRKTKTKPGAAPVPGNVEQGELAESKEKKQKPKEKTKPKKLDDVAKDVF